MSSQKAKSLLTDGSECLSSVGIGASMSPCSGAEPGALCHGLVKGLSTLGEAANKLCLMWGNEKGIFF